MNSVTGVWNLKEGWKDTAQRQSRGAPRRRALVAVKKEGNDLVVDLTRLFESDKQPADWAAAAVPV